jgi:hypothetical protein
VGRIRRKQSRLGCAAEYLAGVMLEPAEVPAVVKGGPMVPKLNMGAMPNLQKRFPHVKQKELEAALQASGGNFWQAATKLERTHPVQEITAVAGSSEDPHATANTSVGLLPWYLCIPAVFPVICCQQCDGKDGNGHGCCEMFCRFALCCYQQAGEWSGVYDLSPSVEFELSGGANGALKVVTDGKTRLFKLSLVESVSVFSSTCEYRIIGTQLRDRHDGSAAVCSNGAALVAIYSGPVRQPVDQLPSCMDACTDPCLNAYARSLCIGNLLTCGSSVSGTEVAKRVSCAFLGARVANVGVVRLSQRAWRPAAVGKLAMLEAKVHREFPHLVPVSSTSSPGPLQMDRHDRMAYRATGVIRTMEVAYAAA